MSEVKTALKFAAECRAFGCEIIEAARRKPGTPGREFHAALFLARTTTALESVEILASAGLNDDAASVGRTINETAIDIAFIMKEDTQTRLRLFFEHEAVRDWHWVQAIDKLHGGTSDKQAMETIKARYDEVKAQYAKNEYQWCGTIGWRARETELDHLYDIGYADGCAASHSGAQGLRRLTTEVEDDLNITVTVHVGRRDPSPQPIHLACMNYLIVAGNAINLAELQTQFDERHTDLWRRLQAML